MYIKARKENLTKQGKKINMSSMLVDLTQDDDDAPTPSTTSSSSMSANDKQSIIFCPACTFANEVTALNCKICNTKLDDNNNNNTNAIDDSSFELAKKLQQQEEVALLQQMQREEDAITALAMQQQQQQQQHQQSGVMMMMPPSGLIGVINRENVNIRRARRYWDGRVLGNRLHAGDNSENITDFYDLVEPKDLQKAFVTTFTHHPDMIPLLFGEALQSNTFQELILVDHYDTDRQISGIRPYPTQMPYPGAEKVQYVFPFFQIKAKYGIQHAKLMLLRYPERLRIVISSTNLDDVDTILHDRAGGSQVFFVADIRTSSTGNSRGSNTQKNKSANDTRCFGKSLRNFLNKLRPYHSGDDRMNRKSNKIFDGWTNDLKNNFNFDELSKSVYIIASVPGYHPRYHPIKINEKQMQNNDDDNFNDNNNNNNNSKNDNDKYTELYGLARLRELSKNYAKEKDIDGEKNILHAEAQSSSVGRLDMGYWGAFARSCNVSVENMRYVWPSDRQLLANENIHGLGMLCSPTGTMQGWMKDHLVALRVPKERSKSLLHAKTLVAYYNHPDNYRRKHNKRQNDVSSSLESNSYESTPSEGTSWDSKSNGLSFNNKKNHKSVEYAWIYVGSHNFSANAWGRYCTFDDNQTEKINCSSFELGVFVHGEKQLKEASLPVIIPSYRYDHTDARSIDGTVTRLGQVMMQHYCVEQNPWHSDNFRTTVANSLIVKEIVRLLMENVKPVVLIFVSSYCENAEEINNQIDKFTVNFDNEENIHDFQNILKNKTSSVKFIDMDLSKDASCLAFKSIRYLLGRHPENITSHDKENLQPPFMIVYDNAKEVDLGIGRKTAKTKTIIDAYPGLLYDRQHLKKMLDLDVVTLDRFSNALDVVVSKRGIIDNEKKEARLQRELNMSHVLDIVCMKKLLIFSSLEDLIKKFSTRHRFSENNFPTCTFLPGRQYFLNAVINRCRERGIPYPSIAIVSNQEGVGLRMAMEIQKWKGYKTKKEKHDTVATSARKMECLVHDLGKLFIVDDGQEKEVEVFLPPPSIKTYVSYMYKSKKNNNEWIPSESLKSKYPDKFQGKEWEKNRRKPSVTMVLEAMKDLKCENPEFCLMFGSNPIEDESLAKSLGIDFMYSKQSNYASGFFEVWKEKEDECAKKETDEEKKAKSVKERKKRKKSSAKANFAKMMMPMDGSSSNSNSDNINNKIESVSKKQKIITKNSMIYNSYSPFTFYRNALHSGIINQDKNGLAFDVKSLINHYCDTRTLKGVIISTFRLNLRWICDDKGTQCFHLTKNKIPTLILHGDAKTERFLKFHNDRNSGRKNGTMMKEDGTLYTRKNLAHSPDRESSRRENVRKRYPIKPFRLPENYDVWKVNAPTGTYHAKFVLLFLDTGIHVVISTGNSVRQRTIDVSWSQYFPLKPLSTASSSQNSRSDFQEKLSTFLLRADEEVASEDGMLPVRKFFLNVLKEPNVDSQLLKYDFSKSCVSLLTSIPGKGSAKKHYNEKHGHRNLRKILRDERICPSLKSMNQIHGERKLAHIIVQPTSIGNDFNGVQYASFIDSMCDSSDGINKPKDKLIWPLKNGLTNPSGGNNINSNNSSSDSNIKMNIDKEYDNNPLVGESDKDGCLFLTSKAFLSMGEDGPLADSFHVFEHVDSENAVPHIKLYLRLYAKEKHDDKRIRWIKLGSDCLSVGAQGFYDKRDNSVIMRNWEMGVLFHENASNLLYVGTKADVTVTNENLRKVYFPIPFKCVEPLPYRMEDGSWPDNRIPYMHQYDPYDIYPWTKKLKDHDNDNNNFGTYISDNEITMDVDNDENTPRKSGTLDSNTKTKFEDNNANTNSCLAGNTNVFSNNSEVDDNCIDGNVSIETIWNMHNETGRTVEELLHEFMPSMS